MGVPRLMATQHPDSTRRVGALEEVEEAILDVTPVERGGYGCDEKMIDYEGKLTPYHQPRWVVERALREGLRPGVDFVLTLRIPHFRLEDLDRHMLVLMSGLLANALFAGRVGRPPVQYVVLPMSEDVEDLVAVRRRLQVLEDVLRGEVGPFDEPIDLVPLFEDAFRHIYAPEIVESHRSALIRRLGVFPDSLRVFLGKSDSALAYGHLASLLGVKLALVRLHEWAEENLVKVYPIVGVGKPPLREHLAPSNVDAFTEEYRGYYTVTLQSALRFDTPRLTCSCKALYELYLNPARPHGGHWA